jgi:microcystin-dependent protein
MSKNYGTEMEGPFIGQRVATLPAWTATDEGREVYTEDTKLRHYGTDTGWREYGSGGGGGGSEFDIYGDMLGRSIYLNCSWDGFLDEDLIDATDMTYNATENKYEFTAGEYLQSDTLYDPILAITVTECMVYVDYDDSGSPTIEATADGGANWEAVVNGTVHTFSNTGSDLRIRFTGGGNGEVRSWAVYYNPDPTPQQVLELVPVGTLLMFAGTSAPGGFLLCDGSSLPVVDYPVLFASIGYTWGGAGANFNIPNLQQKMPYGPGGGRSVGDTGGSETKNIAHTHTTGDHTLIVAEMPSHAHGISSSSCEAGGGDREAGTGYDRYSTSEGGDQPHNHGPTGFGGSATQDVLNPYAIVNFIIKY